MAKRKGAMVEHTRVEREQLSIEFDLGRAVHALDRGGILIDLNSEKKYSNKDYIQLYSIVLEYIYCI